MVLAQVKIKYLGHNIENGVVRPIHRVIEVSNKFPDEIKDKTQL